MSVFKITIFARTIANRFYLDQHLLIDANRGHAERLRLAFLESDAQDELDGRPQLHTLALGWARAFSIETFGAEAGLTAGRRIVLHFDCGGDGLVLSLD